MSRGGDILSIIDKIRKKLIAKEYEFAIPHFFEEMAADDLEFADVKRAIETGGLDGSLHGIPGVNVMKLWADP